MRRGWLEWENAIPVSISLPLREDRYVGAPVLAVFENLLPGNKSIRDRVAARVRAPGTDAFSLLGKIGHDCVGALQFLPDGMDPGEVGAIEGRPISDEEIARARSISGGLAPRPFSMPSVRHGLSSCAWPLPVRGSRRSRFPPRSWRHLLSAHDPVC